MISIVVGYALFLPIGLDSSYALAMLPTFLLAGLGFALAFGPLNIAATNGVAPEEQGLAGGLLNTSFQFGGALALAVVTAVVNANTGTAARRRRCSTASSRRSSSRVIVGVLGVVAMASGCARAPSRSPSPRSTAPSGPARDMEAEMGDAGRRPDHPLRFQRRRVGRDAVEEAHAGAEEDRHQVDLDLPAAVGSHHRRPFGG